MKLHVPYFSYSIAQQHTLPLTTDGVTCAKMVLDYFGFNPNEDIHSLIEQGNTIGVCDVSPFVMVDSLVVLLRVHGMSAVKEYFRNNTFDLMLASYVQTLYDTEARENGIATLIASIAEGVPAIVFIRPANNTNGIFEDYPVVVCGYESTSGDISGFYYHDPRNEKGEDAFIEASDFRSRWNRTAILLEK